MCLDVSARTSRWSFVVDKFAVSSLTLRPASDQRSGTIVLGRLVVHDRVAVEAKVLPKYFNHSSFASLRRQLNYFSFVRLGKGRQRESTYVNECVFALDDILNLKRRPAGSAAPDPDAVAAIETNHVPAVGLTKFRLSSIPSRKVSGPRVKRRRLLPQTSLPRKLSSANFVSDEDDFSETKTVSLDLTAATSPDEDVLAGCSALMNLSGQRWD